MNAFPNRAGARACFVALSLAWLSSGPSWAEDPVTLTLGAAAQLAVADQPRIQAALASVQAARESAVAAGQLPDPSLSAGITDLTITGPDRFTRSESDTQLMLGVKQTFPGGAKRDLRARRGVYEADRLAAEADEQVRMVRREASMAWLEVWRALQAQRLTGESIKEAERQAQVSEIAYRAGRASQADLLSTRLTLELLNDQLAGLKQQEWHARNQLARWIGAAAERPLADELPAWAAPELSKLVEHLEHHPHLVAEARAIAVARSELDLAKADYRPDWSVQAGYGYRPEFEDYASLQFEVALPIFTRNRQDRGVEARTAEVSAAEQKLADALRESTAAVRLNAIDWARLTERIARYDSVILPQAGQRLETAMSAYATGSAPLLPALDARRSLLEIRMQRLDLVMDAARHQIELDYYIYQEPTS